MAELKTRETRASVAGFLEKIADESRRKDCQALVKLMKRATGAEPKMWGASIVGFGSCHLKYASGRKLDWFPIGFASRKQDLTLYGLLSAEESDALLERLGKHTRGKGCLYVKRLADIDTTVLQRLIEISRTGA
ncbi:MAG: DUF1801 domain-containing protein [Deltaproteobacteria bacterium]|nr:MAG: DUF1801 domain-containing protein [Deltaproteobacteria bacterium]